MNGSFDERGATVLRGLLSPTWIELLRTAADAILDEAHDATERLGGAATAPSLSSDSMWRRHEPFARFLFGSGVGGAAATAMGSTRVVLFEDLFLYTPAGAPGSAWHRDAPHWPVRGAQLASVWLSLEPVGLDEGALHFVAGSHRDPDDEVRQEAMVTTVDEGPGGDLLAWATEPGDAVVFHPRIRHAALGAAPDRPRRTFTLRFAGDDVRWRPRSAYFHPWMADAGLAKGDPLDHPWFPVVP